MKNQVQGRRNLIASFVASALASAAGAPGITWAQESGATLQGKAEADSEVTAKNVDTGLTRHTKTGSDGTYTIVGLPAGTYNVDAGPGTQQTVTLNVATTEVLDLQKLETVTVSGTVQRLTEVKTSEIGFIVSQQQIETVPQLTRNFLEFADTVPGMEFKVDSSGNASLRGGAQNTSSVNVYIDGVGQKNYVKEGGVSGQFFTQGNPFPQLAIGEYKVITSNYKAEYDQISSAAVTAETKSGTNKFEGEIFGTYTGQNFRAETPSELNTNPNVKTPSKDKEFGLAFGGPIIQDVAHFFVTYEGKRYTTPIAITAGGGPPPPSILAELPASVRAQIGPEDKSVKEDLYFGKLDWELGSADRLVTTAKVRRESQSGIDAGSIALSASFDTLNNDKRFDVRWEHSADRWFNQVVATYEDSFTSPTPNAFGNGAIYTWQPAGPLTGNDQTIITTGPAEPRAAQNKGQKGPAIEDEFTFSHLQWSGDHTVKTGIKYKWVKLTAQDAANINPQFFYDVSATGTAPVPYKAFFTKPVPGQQPVAESSNRQLGIYLQDDWAVNDHFTLNLGVRWDYEVTPTYQDYVTPANVVAALLGPNPAQPSETYAQALAKGGVNVNDYISNGHNRSAYTGEIQPRIGFSYDLLADQRHVVFGGYGRSYDRDLFDYLQLEETKASLPEYTVFFNRPDHPCTPGGTCFAWDSKYLNGLSNLQQLIAATNVGAEVDALNNHLKAPYSDQFSLGIRNRLGDWNTSFAVARINSYGGFAFTLGNRYPNGAFFMNGGQPWGNGVPGFGALIIGNNAIKTRNTEVLIGADKAYTAASHWGATIAYTFTSASQNRAIGEHYSFDEATLAQYPFIASNAVAKHRLVMTGSVGIPWDVIVAGKLSLATPVPYNQFSCTVTNPPTFFPTGSGCQAFAATPPGLGYRSFDLELTKSFEVHDISTLQVRVDVLNVFNVKNYNDYILGGNNGVVSATSVLYNPIGNIVGVPRTLRMTLSAKF